MSRPARRLSGFTLIELLVVIAIIAILFAITSPMLPALNDQARVATCESRLQQLGVALRLYQEDHRRRPAALEDLTREGYVESPATLRCDKTANAYYYRPAPLTAAPETLLLACCDPRTPAGRRPHRYGDMLVALTAAGEPRRVR
jgi:prepilin-type N-terminal cleavage/methylation domain-containing protein